MPQTQDKPSSDSTFAKHGAAALFDAIIRDDPELALPFFFPAEAYARVKAVKRPEWDFEHRLVAHFKRDVHEYHRALGRARDTLKFERLEIPDDRARWMDPGTEGNRLGYYRVLRSRLVYSDESGKERWLEVTSLISWRGEWYLVHLHGFQ